MNTDTQTSLIAARSFFRQLRSYGCTPNQILRVINELLELVTATVREQKQRSAPVEAGEEASTSSPDGR
jgi:uncharacterized membrane protein